jgi:hypothetical protein
VTRELKDSSCSVFTFMKAKTIRDSSGGWLHISNARWGLVSLSCVARTRCAVEYSTIGALLCRSVKKSLRKSYVCVTLIASPKVKLLSFTPTRLSTRANFRTSLDCLKQCWTIRFDLPTSSIPSFLPSCLFHSSASLVRYSLSLKFSDLATPRLRLSK